MDEKAANILECGAPAAAGQLSTADMSAHSKAIPDSPAVAGFAFYVS